MLFPNAKIFPFLAVIFMLFSVAGTFAQEISNGNRNTQRIETGVPFLMIGPDARSGAMGDAGVAISPDGNSIHWNPSKLAFLDERSAVAVSYSPWLQNLVSDMYLAYLGGYYKIDDRNTVAVSLRYFSAGDIELREGPADVPGIARPNELAVDGTLARKFGRDFSLATSLRFVYSNLSGGQAVQGQQVRAGTAIAVDVSGYYKHETVVFGKDNVIAAGANISNIGSKISYTDGGRKLFLPTNLKIGAASTVFFDAQNEFTLTLDINKLLVPSPPIRDSGGNIESGKDPDKSVPTAIFGSFSDAPGGFSEELREISYSVGAEYLYNKLLAIRAGYFYENPEKGDRRYLTLGAGLRYNKFKLDFSYLAASQDKSPLANTLRFTLGYKIK